MVRGSKGVNVRQNDRSRIVAYERKREVSPCCTYTSWSLIPCTCKGGFERLATVEPRQRVTTTTANTTTTTPRGGCTKTPWWGSGWRPHSPPLEMISVATRSREPQHVPCPSQSELNSLLDSSLCIRFSLRCVFSLKIGYFGEHERVYGGCGKGKSENFPRCILIYPFFLDHIHRIDFVGDIFILQLFVTFVISYNQR